MCDLSPFWCPEDECCFTTATWIDNSKCMLLSKVNHGWLKNSHCSLGLVALVKCQDGKQEFVHGHEASLLFQDGRCLNRGLSLFQMAD